MPVSKEILDEVALSEKEYQLIVEKLGRETSEVELGMFGSLWSEHCGYKHSKALLKQFPSRSKRVLVGPGEENAGVVDIGDGLVIVMKIESHNHPSAIEPYQGAATGVGGIVRDIFTMGARPIALMNSLRFGPLTDPHNRYLFGGVVGGIASYGNCLGIPDVGGEIYFADCYAGNPLVNALCLGIAKADKLVKARAYGEGNLLMLVGADTGRDGLHGASGLASRTFEEERELRSAVQVGNPFLEKLLIEACLELAETDWIAGMQDLGAAGLTSSAVESAARGGGLCPRRWSTAPGRWAVRGCLPSGLSATVSSTSRPARSASSAEGLPPAASGWPSTASRKSPSCTSTPGSASGERAAESQLRPGRMRAMRMRPPGRSTAKSQPSSPVWGGSPWLWLSPPYT